MFAVKKIPSLLMPGMTTGLPAITFNAVETGPECIVFLPVILPKKIMEVCQMYLFLQIFFFAAGIFFLIAVTIQPVQALQDIATSGAKLKTASVKDPAGIPQPDGFRVAVIGSGLPSFDLEKGTQSILVQYRDKMFLVDCGSGSMHGLMEAGIRPEKITNMFFTHQHVDHNADFWGFFIIGWNGPMGRRSLNLAGPDVRELYDTTLEFFKTDLDYRINDVGSSTDGLKTNVNIIDFKRKTEAFEIDGVKITVMEVPHTIITYAYKFEAGGQRVVISGDLKYTDKFTSFAKNADILVIDGLMAADFGDIPESFRNNLIDNLRKSHVTDEEIAKIATDASPKNLVLVHWAGKITLEKNTKLYRDMGYKGIIIKGIDGLVINP
jgi:ribonuclease BN (tRNA processing enzyme)